MNDNIEIIGYLASALVAASFIMKNINRLRLVNLLGALCFVVYGWLIGRMPIVGFNLLIVAIQLHYFYSNRTRSN